MSKTRQRLLGIVFSLCAVLAAGCEDVDTGPSGSGAAGASTTTSTGGSGGDAGQGGDGGSGGDAGHGGTGGQGGSTGPVAESPPTGEWVSSGGVAKSEKYRMVFTMGEPTMSAEGSKSSTYRIQGGLIAASGSEQ